MDWWIVFAIFLYFAAAALLIAEVFVPSGGIISALSLACVIGGVAIFFKHSIAAGWIGVGIAVVMIPSCVIFAYRLLPKTRFGKNVILNAPQRPSGDAIPDTEQLKGLMGATGVVTTPLRPVGMCEFSGQKVECVAEGGYVDKGKKVQVIEVQSTKVVVRVIES